MGIVSDTHKKEKPSTGRLISIGEIMNKPSGRDAVSSGRGRRRTILYMYVSSIQDKAKSKF